MRTIRFAAPTVLFFALLAACGSTSTGTSDPPPPPPTTGAQSVGISGTHMTLDDQPWMSRGVVLQAFVRPLAALQTSTQTQVLHARLNYGAAELAAIHSFHADTIRFQIGQPALDPASPLYDPDYFTDVVNAIKQARQAGFVVMIMIQDEKISGESVQYPLPIAETQRDWDLFTTTFGSDRGVVFELYNEPSLTPSPANWQLWLNGGMVFGQTQPSIGMQPLINHIRANARRMSLCSTAWAGRPRSRACPRFPIRSTGSSTPCILISTAAPTNRNGTRNSAFPAPRCPCGPMSGPRPRSCNWDSAR